MPKFTPPPLNMAVVVVAVALSSGAVQAQQYTAVNALYKVRPGISSAVDPKAVLSSPITLHAARNDFEMFQVVVDAGPGPVPVAEPSLTLVSGSGNSIPASNIRFYRLELIPFSQASNHEGAQQAAGSNDWYDKATPISQVVVGAEYANLAWLEDQYLPAEPWLQTVSGNTRAVYLVEIQVPDGQAPGVYSGTLTFGSGRWDVDLTVANVTLPLTSSLPTLIRASANPLCRAHHAVTNNQCWTSENKRRFQEMYGRLLLDHRLTIGLDDSSFNVPPDWAARRNDYWSAYGALITGTDQKLRLSAGTARSAATTTVPFSWWRSESGTPLPGSENENRYDAWKVFVQDHSALDVEWVDYPADADEPHHGSNGLTSLQKWQNFRRHAQVNQTRGGVLQLLLTSDKVAITSQDAVQAGVTESDVNIYSPVLDWIDASNPGDSSHYARAQNYASFVSGGGELWGYQSCDQHSCGASYATNPDNAKYAVDWPNLMADAYGVQNRAEPWLHFIYGLTGMLYYDVALKVDSADVPNGLFNEDGNGDGTLVYAGAPPGTDGKHYPIASHRLKLLREGMEDYELLTQCSAFEPQTAMVAAKSIFKMKPSTFPEYGAMYSAGNYSTLNTWALPNQFAFIDAYNAQKGVLIKCIESHGAALYPNWQSKDDQGVISAPFILGPVHVCGEPGGDLLVEVAGTVPGAEVELCKGTCTTPGNTVATFSNGGTKVRFSIDNSIAQIHIGHTLAARQRNPGAAWSPEATLTVTGYPSGPNGASSPDIAVVPAYQCATVSMAVGLTPGSRFWFEVGPNSPGDNLDPGVSGSWRSNYSGTADVSDFPTRPLDLPQREIRVVQQFCGMTSMHDANSIRPIEEFTDSITRTSRPRPPKLETCSSTKYDGSECFSVTDLIPGARFRLYDAAGHDVGATSFPAYVSAAMVEIETSSAPKPITARQELCEQSDPSNDFFPADGPGCSEMPAPRPKQPKINAEEIVLEDYLPGATFYVFGGVNSDEKLGQGSYFRIPLWRGLTSSDRVRVFQVLRGCTGFASLTLTPSGG